MGNNSSVVLYDKSFDGDSYQFDISDTIQDIVCYHRDKYYVALATDKNAVLEYSYLSGNPNDDPFAEVSTCTCNIDDYRYDRIQ